MNESMFKFYDDLLGQPGVEKLVTIGVRRKGVNKRQILKACESVYNQYLENPDFAPRIALGSRVYAEAKIVAASDRDVVPRTFKDCFRHWWRWGEWR